VNTLPPPPWFRSNLSPLYRRLARKCDGIVFISSSTYEPGSFEAFRKWFSEIDNRELYTVGPLLPLGVRDASGGFSAAAMSLELDLSENGDEFQTFMDRIMKTHGKRSLIYVSRSRSASLSRCF
jgi:hypothetical protein